MITEITQACKLLEHWLKDKIRPGDTVGMEVFKRSLTERLLVRYANHWFPEEPKKGNSYRCLWMSGHMDESISAAARDAGYTAEEFCRWLPQDTYIWIDPQEVDYRCHGSNGVYEFYRSPGYTAPAVKIPRKKTHNKKLRAPAYYKLASSNYRPTPASVRKPIQADPTFGVQVYLHQNQSCRTLGYTGQFQNIDPGNCDEKKQYAAYTYGRFRQRQKHNHSNNLSSSQGACSNNYKGQMQGIAEHTVGYDKKYYDHGNPDSYHIIVPPFWHGMEPPTTNSSFIKSASSVNVNQLNSSSAQYLADLNASLSSAPNIYSPSCSTSLAYLPLNFMSVTWQAVPWYVLVSLSSASDMIQDTMDILQSQQSYLATADDTTKQPFYLPDFGDLSVQQPSPQTSNDSASKPPNQVPESTDSTSQQSNLLPTTADLIKTKPDPLPSANSKSHEPNQRPSADSTSKQLNQRPSNYSTPPQSDLRLPIDSKPQQSNLLPVTDLASNQLNQPPTTDSASQLPNLQPPVTCVYPYVAYNPNLLPSTHSTPEQAYMVSPTPAQVLVQPIPVSTFFNWMTSLKINATIHPHLLEGMPFLKQSPAAVVHGVQHQLQQHQLQQHQLLQPHQLLQQLQQHQLLQPHQLLQQLQHHQLLEQQKQQYFSAFGTLGLEQSRDYSVPIQTDLYTLPTILSNKASPMGIHDLIHCPEMMFLNSSTPKQHSTKSFTSAINDASTPELRRSSTAAISTGSKSRLDILFILEASDLCSPEHSEVDLTDDGTSESILELSRLSDSPLRLVLHYSSQSSDSSDCT